MNTISILTNSNLNFIRIYLENNFKKYSLINYNLNVLQYGQLYQTLLNKEDNIYKSRYCFFLLTIEDIFNEEICLKFNNDYISIIDNFYKLIKSFCKLSKGNLYFFKIKKTYYTPFDDTKYDISQSIDYINKVVKKIDNLHFINNFYNQEKYDLNLYLESRCYFSLEYLNYISNKITGIIIKDNGKTIKCIIVDLDNTIWGGVLVDDGINGIKISNDYPDNKWQYFQKILKGYSEKGVMLCICSKNNSELVLNALKDKRNILNKSDFLIIKANWERKSKNIYEISKQLNINEEHILFIDDNPIEREEVKQNLPKCNILDIEKICPLHYSQKMHNSPLLYNFNIIDSDLKKKQKYEIKMKFDQDKKSFDNIEKFYMSLNTNITFNFIDKNSFDRSFQLTSKTNQFNLNKYIFNQEEFKEYLNKNIGIILEYNDKFTTHDKVGLILLQKNDKNIIIDNIILSCRVFNRDFEKCIFIMIEKIAKLHKSNIIGKIKKTNRNTNFHDIYKKFGFIYDEINNFFIKNEIQCNKYPDWIKCNDEKIVNINNKNYLNMEINDEKLFDTNIHKNDNIIDNSHNIQKIEEFIIDSLMVENKNIKKFSDIEGFSSLNMVFILNKVNSKYNINLIIDDFYDKNNNIVSINKISIIIHTKKLDINNITNKNLSKNISEYGLSISTNKYDLKKTNEIIEKYWGINIPYLDKNIVNQNLKGYRDFDKRYNFVILKKYSDNIHLNHIGIVCQSIENTISYFKKLGFIQKTEIIYDKLQETKLVLIGTNNKKISLDRFNDLNETYIELVEPLKQNKKLLKILDKSETLYHMCLEVDSIEDFIHKNKNDVVIMSKPKKALLFNNRRVCFLYFKKNKNLIEILEKYKQPIYSISGLNGAINIYIQYVKNNNIHYTKAIEFIQWKYSDKKKSLTPLNYFINNYDSIIVSGMQKNTSMKIFSNLNFKIINPINIYVLPLKLSYKNLLIDKNINENEIQIWLNKIYSNYKNNNILNKSDDINLLDNLFYLWNLFSIKHNLISYYKNKDFFQWKLNNAYYTYNINGNLNDGYIIWREEETYTSSMGIRIVDIIPGKDAINNKTHFDLFISKFINFCINQNYEVIDFYCTSNILETHLFNNHFKLKNNKNIGDTSISIYFKTNKAFSSRNMGIFIKDMTLFNTNTIYFTKWMEELDPPRCRFCKKAFCSKLYTNIKCNEK